MQLEACTVAELELLLSSWASLAGAGRNWHPWCPPPHILHAVVRRLRPDPNQVRKEQGSQEASTFCIHGQAAAQQRLCFLILSFQACLAAAVYSAWHR
eukprot:scaffold133278_cov23-Tisochrysis_lutea.AAC.1